MIIALLSRSVAILLLSAATASAFPQEPDGFDKARLGMNLEQLQTAYPGVTRVPKPERTVFPETEEDVDVWHVTGVRMSDREGTSDLRFLLSQGKLYLLTILVGSDDFRRLHAQFKKQYGPPSISSSNPTWYGDKVILSVYPQGNKIEISDRVTTEQYGAKLFNMMSGKTKTGHSHGAGAAGAPSHPAHEPESGH